MSETPQAPKPTDKEIAKAQAAVEAHLERLYGSLAIDRMLLENVRFSDSTAPNPRSSK